MCTAPPPNTGCEDANDIKTMMKNRKFSIEDLVAYFEYNSETEKPEIRYKKRNIPGDD